jgi:hypothetical protein
MDLLRTTPLQPRVTVDYTDDYGLRISINGGSTTPALLGLVERPDVFAEVGTYFQEHLSQELGSWPLCEEHDTGLHAEVHEGVALWWCRYGNHAFAQIGELPSHPSRSSARTEDERADVDQGLSAELWTFSSTEQLTPEEQSRVDALLKRLRDATTPEERDAATAGMHTFLRERRSRRQHVTQIGGMQEDPDEDALCCFCMKTTTITVGGDGVHLRIDRLGSSDSSGLYAHVECLRTRIHPEFPSDPPFE